MKALEFSRKETKYAAAAIASKFTASGGAKYGPLSLTDRQPISLPNEEWQHVRTRLSGICGSDIATVNAKSSQYFEPWVSFPFILGHEIVGELSDGTRVVIEPVLGHACRGITPPFENAAPGDGEDYSHLVSGALKPGIQTGYCASTGGGWSEEFIAHRSQIHTIPDAMSDEAAVMIEPTSVGVHAAYKAAIKPNQSVAIIGAGTMGLVALAALRHFTEAETILVGAKYEEQKEKARQLGATTVVNPQELMRAVRRHTKGFIIGSDLSNGVDVVIDTIGTSDSIQEAIGMTRPKGRVVLVGMPNKVTLNLTSLWHRETELVGAYTYGTETMSDGTTRKTFDLAMELVQEANLESLVSSTYRLAEYEKALEHATQAGRRGSIKICFDLRSA